MQGTSAGARMLRRVVAAATTAVFIGTVVAPGLVMASGGAPTVPQVNVITAEDTPVSGNLLTNATDPENDALHLVSHGQFNAGLGSVSINNATGAYTFTPTANANGTAYINFTTSDGSNAVASKFYVTVTAVNDAPACASPVTTSGGEDTQQSGTVTCTDVEHSPLTYSLVAGASHGTAVVHANGAWTYDPIGNYNGSDSFTFRAYDGTSYSSAATVDVTVTASNDAPVCGDVDPPDGLEDHAQSGTLSCSDVDLDTLSYTKMGNPAHGSVTVASNGDWEYTPDANYNGTDTFDYRASDGTTHSATQTVYLNVVAVNDPPECPAGSDTISEDGHASGTVTCTDVEGSDLTYSKATEPENGTATMGANGAWTYDPDKDFNGSDSFTYIANDGTDDSAPATITVTISAVNDDPVAVDGTVTVVEDTATDVTDQVVELGSDVDGNSLTVSSATNATGGAVNLHLGVVTFTPAANQCGLAEGGFDFTISDGHGGQDSAHATVDVTCENDSPVAVDKTITVSEDTATDVTSQVLAGDTDVEDDTLTVTDVAGATGGDVAVDEAGLVTFTPDGNLCGLAAGGFDYTISDGNGGSDTAHATVNITCANDNPVAPDLALNGTEDEALPNTDADLLADATDVDSLSLSIASVDNATGGDVAWDAGVTTFTPDAELCGEAAAGFDYTVADGDGGTATGHVTVDLECVEDAPVAPDITGTAAENQTAKSFDVLASASDVDVADVLELTDASVDPSAGTVAIDGGLLWYTPTHGFSGDAQISYTVSDGQLDATGTLTVTVAEDLILPVESVPTVAFGSGRVDETAPLTISWSATDANGIVGYQVQVSVAGGSFASVYSGAARSVTKFYGFNKSLVWRVRAQDGAGNWSGWVLSATRKLIAYQAPGSTAVTYTGTWANVSSSGSSGTGYRYVSVPGKYAQLKFTGRAVLYVAPKISSGGYVKVYVDGKLLGKFSNYRASTALGQILAHPSWGTSGTHTIRIVNDQYGKHITLDAFIVLR